MESLFCLAPCWTSTNASVLWISPNHSVSHIIHAFHVMASGGLANFESMVSHTLPSFYRTGQTAEVERCSSVHMSEYIQIIGFGHRLEAINSAMFCSSNKMIDIAGVWSQHSSATCPRKSCKPTWRWEIEASPAVNINQLSSATFSHCWPPWSADKGLCGSLKTGDGTASTAVWNPSRENVTSFWRMQDVVKDGQGEFWIHVNPLVLGHPISPIAIQLRPYVMFDAFENGNRRVRLRPWA